MKICLIQYNPQPDIRLNAGELSRLLHQAEKNKPELCIVSGGALSGWPLYSIKDQQDFELSIENVLQTLSLEIQTPTLLHAGISLYLLEQGQVRKLEQGKLKIAKANCYLALSLDYEQFTTQVKQAEKIKDHLDYFISIAALPYTFIQQKEQEHILSTLSMNKNITCFLSNAWGCQDGLIFNGQSLIVAPQGLAVRSAFFAEDIIYYPTKPEQIKPSPLSQEQAWWQALVEGLRDFARKSGFDKAVLGLSGGMDSALVAAIATEAFGAEQVMGLMMASPWTSESSVVDATELAANLGIKTQYIDIAPLMSGFEQALQALFENLPKDVTEENIQARIRGNLLMATANKFKALLLNTGNKSELAVGYCTMYGDTCGGLSLIADLYKTQVYTLAKAYNTWNFESKNKNIIPDSILTKPPSAELRPDQKDQDSLPPYEELDHILEQIIECKLLPEQVQANPDTVDRVKKLLLGAEFKRWQTPPPLQLSSRPFGFNFKLPTKANL